GGPDGSGSGFGESLVPIEGSLSPFVGEMICQLGAYSGPRCNIQITSRGWSHFADENGQNGFDAFVFSSHTLDGSEAGGQGDSGGPVITLASPGFYAMGTVTGSANGHDVPCVGIVFFGRKCSSSLLFPSIDQAVQVTGTFVQVDPNRPPPGGG